jgi:biotin/methionine sulfoxide reductase
MTGVRHSYTAAHWGIYEVHRGEGESPQIRPFSQDPDPSPIGLDQLDPGLARLRVARPAVRRSFLQQGPSRGELRGREPFVEVSWDVALELVARELQRVRREHGNRSIFGGSYGWSSAGRFHHANGQVHRFLNLLGGYVRSVDSYSLGAGRALMPHVVTDMDDSNASHYEPPTFVTG